MTRRDRHLLFGLAALALTLAALSQTGAHGDALLALPGLLFALPLLVGRYVGAERLARLASAFVAARRRPVASLPVAVRRSPRSLPRGGHLIAASLAVRPPPPGLRMTA